MPRFATMLLALLTLAVAEEACLDGECPAQSEEAALLQHQGHALTNKTTVDCYSQESTAAACAAHPMGCRPSFCIPGDVCCIEGTGCEFCGALCEYKNCQP